MNWRMLLSHHHAHEEGQRCVHLWGISLCRRCLLLYPLVFAVMIAGLMLGDIEPPWLYGVMFGGPTLASTLFILEQTGKIPYKPWQIWLGTPPLALALGVGFVRYLQDPTDRLFWAMVLFYGLPCLAAVWHRHTQEGEEDS